MRNGIKAQQLLKTLVRNATSAILQNKKIKAQRKFRNLRLESRILFKKCSAGVEELATRYPI